MPSAVRALTRALSRALPRRRRPPGPRALTSHRRPPRTKALLPARVVLPATLCLCTVLGAAPGASATPARWSVAPAGGGRPSFYAEGPPGSVLQDTVAVNNPGRAPVVVRLSGSGLRTVFADKAGDGIRVPARTRAEVPFTVTVPAGAAPGDRSGAVVARDTRGRTATVPVRLRVGGPALAALTVEHLAVHAEGITYELVNRGTTVLVPRLAVRADGVLGRVLDRAPRTLPVHLRPGARVKLTEPWPDRPALDAVDVRLTVTAPGGAHDTATTSARFVPWPAVAGGALLAGAIAVLAVRRRRHHTPSDDPAPEHSAPDPPTPGAPASDAPAARNSSSDPLPAGTSASTAPALDGRALGGCVTGSLSAGVAMPGVAAPGGLVAGGLSSGHLSTGASASTAPPLAEVPYPGGELTEGAVQ
ncbi:COG1470 family protein [Streptomyces sp. NPDC003233]